MTRAVAASMALCSDSPAQLWRLVPSVISELHTYYTGPDFCLHGSPLDDDPGERVSMQPCQQTPQQIWLKITSG